MSIPAALHGIESACYTGQSFCNLCCNCVTRKVAKEIAACNTTLKGVITYLPSFGYKIGGEVGVAV